MQAEQAHAYKQPEFKLPGGRVMNPWMVLLSLMFGFFMSLLDATVVNIAISDIQRDLKTDLTTVSWVLSAYNLVFAVLLVTMGRFADQYGRKLVFMLGMIMFSLGSFLCAIAPSIEYLIAFRAIQGIGAAALNPISLALITVVFPPAKRGGAFAVWGAAAGMAAAIGPILGGFLVTISWRWIFFVNLPFCIIGLVMVWFFVPETRDQNASRKIDFLGLITISSTMFCLVLAIIEGNSWGWTSGGILGLFATSIISLALFIFIENRVAQPIVDFKLFKYRSFVAANITMFMFGIGIQGAFLILVLFFIQAQGYTQLGAAYALIPLPVASFIFSALAGRFNAKLNPRYMGIAGTVIVAIGLLSLVTLGVNDGWLDTAWRGIIIGAGMGLCFTTFPSMALSEIPFNRVGVASGVFNTFRQIGFALGVAILISVFTGQITDKVVTARTNAINAVQASQPLPAQVKSNIVTGLQNSASQAQGSGEGTSSSSTSYDLTKLVPLANIPNGEALRPELVRLNGVIAGEFKAAAVNSFDFTWLIAGLVAVVGIVPALFTRAPQRRKEGEAAPAFVAEMG